MAAWPVGFPAAAPAGSCAQLNPERHFSRQERQGLPATRVERSTAPRTGEYASLSRHGRSACRRPDWGCGDSTGPTVPTLGDLLGTWDLTALVLTTHEPTPRTRDRVADGTQTQVLTVTAGGHFDLYACVPDVLCAHLPGTLTIAGDSIHFAYTHEGPFTERVRLSGAKLTLDSEGPGYFLATDATTQLLSTRRVFTRQ